jgi:hypothetical protein
VKTTSAIFHYKKIGGIMSDKDLKNEEDLLERMIETRNELEQLGHDYKTGVIDNAELEKRMAHFKSRLKHEKNLIKKLEK